MQRENRALYRLIIKVDDQVRTWDDCQFSEYEGAQAHVAAAVRTFARTGDVREVAVQRSSTRSANPKTADPPQDALTVWHTERRWGRPVIERILTQEAQPTRCVRPKAVTRARHKRPSRRQPLEPQELPKPHEPHEPHEPHATSLGVSPEGTLPLDTVLRATLLKVLPPALPAPAAPTPGALLKKPRPNTKTLRTPLRLPRLPCEEDVFAAGAALLSAKTDDLKVAAPLASRVLASHEPRATNAKPERPSFRNHGWHIAATVAFIALVWFFVLVVQAGGKLSDLLEQTPVRQEPLPAEMPHNPAGRFADPLTSPREPLTAANPFTLPR